MSVMMVQFLSDEYELPGEILTFLEITEQFEKYHGKLIQLTTKCMKETAINKIKQLPDLDLFRHCFEEIANDIIVNLTKYNIYDITIEDLVDDNEGYKQFLGTQLETVKKQFESLQSSIQSLEWEYQRASEMAANRITGSGVLVWTSSLIDAFAYAAVESSILKQQSNKAEAEYNATVREINARIDVAEQKKDYEIMFEYYYPEIQKNLALFVSESLELYLNTLDRNGKFNYSLIKKYNLPRSSALLKNLDVVQDKEALLKQAFCYCPYNPDIYAKVVDLGIYDLESFTTAKKLRMGEMLSEYVLQSCRNRFKMQSDSLHIIRVLTMLNDKDEASIFKTLLAPQIGSIQNDIDNILNITKNTCSIIEWIKRNFTSNALKLSASEEQCRNIIASQCYRVAQNDLMGYLLSQNVIKLPEKYKSLITSLDYETVVEAISNQMAAEIMEIVEKIKRRSSESLIAAEKLKTELDKETAINTAQLNCINADIQKYEAQLRQAKLFEFSKKKQLANHIASLRKKVQDVKESEKLKQLQKEYDEMSKCACEVWCS